MNNAQKDKIVAIIKEIVAIGIKYGITGRIPPKTKAHAIYIALFTGSLF